MNNLKKKCDLTSLVIQWLRIHLPKQGTWVQSLVREDSTCCGATKPVLITTEPAHLGPALCNQTAHCSEKPIPRDKA